MPQLVTFHLKQLRCIVESDSRGGSEPYLWVTYFIVDGRNIAQPEPVSTLTPVYDAFRKEFPDDVRDGQVMNVPPFIANFSAQIDPGPLNFMLAGCVVVLLEEDDSPDKAMRAGRNTYATGIHQELNKLVKERIKTLNREPVTQAEIDAIHDAIEPKITSAVRSNLTFRQQIFGNQDDTLGFAHVAFIGDEIQTKDFEFPELADRGRSNRFVLSGSLTVGPVPPPPVDRCATFRAAVQAKRDEIKGLQSLRAGLQLQLQTATPQAKPAIVQQITRVGAQIAQAEEELRQREARLRFCEGGVLDPG